MKRISSISDFYFRVSKNDWYKKVVIYAHARSNWGTVIESNYESATAWMDKWATRVGIDKLNKTCYPMAKYLNECVDKMKSEGETIPEE